MHRVLTQETRLTILRLKDEWHRRPNYPDVVSATNIYDAVLSHGVKSPAEFETYLR
jgi:hypothetical protein